MTGKRGRRARAAEAAAAAEALFDAASDGPDPGRKSASASPGGDSVADRARAEADQAATTFAADDAVVRRTKHGWRVGSDEFPDLTCAMVLADLLAAENGLPQVLPGKPDAPGQATETGRLRATVGQLEHALATRIRVEQAIGVLAERHRIKPRQAFEQLREAARSRGRKVIDIAGDVVASATNPLLQLPDELSRPRSGPRRAARQPSGAQ